MLPLAPGRFSTITCWPSRRPSGSATTRALLSATPPGAKGTMMRIGFAGQSSECAGPAASNVSARKNATDRERTGLISLARDEQGDRKGPQQSGKRNPAAGLVLFAG